MTTRELRSEVRAFVRGFGLLDEERTPCGVRVAPREAHALTVLAEAERAGVQLSIDGRKLAPGSGHADHVRASVNRALPAAEGVLVGFFSKRHHGVFTHMGSNTHFHVVLPERPLMGHVDGVTLARGAHVLLPSCRRFEA